MKGKPNIEIDSGSGFCFGVSRAVRMAEEQLEKGTGLTSIGEIVHNEEEVERLRLKGLSTSALDRVHSSDEAPLLFRAHGEPPASYKKVKEEGRTLIDATCPVVLKLQQRVHKAWLQAKAEDGQVVIYGKKGHPEVTGLWGYTDNEALVVQHPEDLEQLDPDKKVFMFAQTTMSQKGYAEIQELIRGRLSNPDNLMAHNTICGQVANRVPRLKEFANRHDVVIFVGGTRSSNAKVLFEACKAENSRTHFVAGAGDIDPQWFGSPLNSIGICGATSTPYWLMEQVEKAVDTILGKQ